MVFCRRDYGKIKKGSFVVDVGANIGVFTIYSLMKGAKQVEAFEPCEETFNVLKENIKFNKFDSRVKIHNLAVSDFSNKEVFVPKKSSPYNKIHKQNYLEKEMNKVKTINLEEALRSSAKIDLIKVDCEGADFEIFSSAQNKWLEVSSVSNFETFQSIRLKLKYKDINGKNQFAHTLNGSSLALPRIMAGILENNQTNDSIKIPKVLIPYTDFKLIN